jgi:hypothetical protein
MSPHRQSNIDPREKAAARLLVIRWQRTELKKKLRQEDSRWTRGGCSCDDPVVEIGGRAAVARGRVGKGRSEEARLCESPSLRLRRSACW